MRALNPLASGDAALLTAVSDPKWQLNGLRNGDLSEALFGEPPTDPKERKHLLQQRIEFLHPVGPLLLRRPLLRLLPILHP